MGPTHHVAGGNGTLQSLYLYERGFMIQPVYERRLPGT